MNELEHIVANCDPDTKLAVTQWVMKHIVNHARDGGSYRHLIYNRLGFETEAYAPLCIDGITISNEFDLNYKEQVREVIEVVIAEDERNRLRSDWFRLRIIKIKIEELKKELGFCDEPGCVKDTSCRFLSSSGAYRRTCGDHYQK